MDEDLKTRLKSIKAVAFDGDGVLFTGRVFMDKNGEALKERSFIDGQGISLLKRIGIKIAFVTAEKSGFLEVVVEKFNASASVIDGTYEKIEVFTGYKRQGKVDAIDGWLSKKNISWQETAVMGDDVVDYQLLKKAGFAAAPAQAEEVIKKNADYVTLRKGGDGAIRDLCNLILEAKGIDQISL